MEQPPVLFGCFFFFSSFFTAWIPPAINPPILAKSIPREGARQDPLVPALTAVPLVRAILAVPPPVAALPVGDALVQLLALELEPAAAAPRRRGGGRHVGTCGQEK